MRFYNNILKAFFAVILLGVARMISGDMEFVKGFSQIEKGDGTHKKLEFPQFADISKVDEFLAEDGEIAGGDDVDKVESMSFNRKLYLLGSEVESLGLEIVEFSIFPLFLLYSSLKLDC